MHYTNAVKRVNILFFVALAVYLFFLSISLDTLNWGDDAYFIEMHRSRNFLDWLKYERYETWSGRLIIDFLMISTITWSWFWKLAIPLCLLLMACSMLKIVKLNVRPGKVLFVFIILALAPVYVIAESFYWITGFYNYLLPVSLAFFCFSQLESKNKVIVFFSIASVFVFSYQEQVVIIFFFAACLSFYNKVSVLKLIILVLTVLNGAVLMLSPGNNVRIDVSTYMYFPNFNDFGFFEKLFLGFDKFYQVFVMPDNWILMIFLFFVLVVSILKESRSASEKISIILIVSYISFFFLQHQHGGDINKGLMNMSYRGEIDFDSISHFSTYSGYFVMLLVMSSTLILLLGSIGVKECRMVLVSTFLGVTSVVMIGFSPTVYASSYRVQMIFELSQALSILYLIKAIDIVALFTKLQLTKQQRIT